LFRNADHTAILGVPPFELENYNEMERYESTCAVAEQPPAAECVGEPPPHGDMLGCRRPLGGGGQFQWVKWMQAKILPEDGA